MVKHSRTKRTAIQVQDLPQPLQELTEEQAERVWGGEMNETASKQEKLLQEKKLLRGAETYFE